METASKALAVFDSENPQSKNDDEKKKQRSELQSRVTLLSTMMEKYDDPGGELKNERLFFFELFSSFLVFIFLSVDPNATQLNFHLV